MRLEDSLLLVAVKHHLVEAAAVALRRLHLEAELGRDHLPHLQGFDCYCWPQQVAIQTLRCPTVAGQVTQAGLVAVAIVGCGPSRRVGLEGSTGSLPLRPREGRRAWLVRCHLRAGYY